MRPPRLLLAILLASAALAATACGAVATPEWAAEAQETRVAQLSTSEYLTAIAPTATFTPSPVPTSTPTAVPPTATPVPPTSTDVPATATPVPPTEAAAAPADLVAQAKAAAQAVGDPAAGQTAFNAQHSLPDGAAWACSSCHSVTPDEVRLIGPGLWNVVVRAAEDRTGEEPLTYIRNSILYPQDYIAPTREGEPGWALNMPAGWDVALDEQQLNDIIAYLTTLSD